MLNCTIIRLQFWPRSLKKRKRFQPCFLYLLLPLSTRQGSVSDTESFLFSRLAFSWSPSWGAEQTLFRPSSPQQELCIRSEWARLRPWRSRLSQRFWVDGERNGLESEDRLSEAHDSKGNETDRLFACHSYSVLLYLLVVRVIVCRGGAALVLFVNWVPSVNVFRQVTFTAEVRRCVVRRLPEPDLDTLAGWWE